MITVIETLHMKQQFCSQDGALAVGQAYDDLLDDSAHAADGYVDHAAFFFAPPSRLLVVYPWADADSARVLIAAEEPQLADFYAVYCTSAREVQLVTELPVEV